MYFVVDLPLQPFHCHSRISEAFESGQPLDESDTCYEAAGKVYLL